MAIETVKAYFKQWNIQHRIIEFDTSSATVELAAQALGCQPARIAKTIALKKEDFCLLVVAAGDAKIDNAKYKAQFGIKAKMLTPEETASIVGHAVGGVCPFGIDEKIEVYLDQSLQRFDSVFPAGGSSNSAIELSIDELYRYANAVGWVDVCKGWQQIEND